MKTTTIFLDTNIYLHYKLFNEIDWCDVLKVHSVVIVVPLVVVNELDRHKTESREKIHRRAQLVIGKFRQIHSRGAGRVDRVRPGVTLRFQDKSPQIDFVAYQLDPQQPDDLILASVIEFQTENPGEDGALVAADFGIELKAKTRQIRVVTLPDDLKLADEPDAAEKRLRQLEQENRELKSSVPILSLSFGQGRTNKEFHIKSPIELPSGLVNDYLAKVTKDRPLIDVPRTNSFQVNINWAGHTIPCSVREIHAYNQRAQKYLELQRTHFIACENIRRRTIQLDIQVENTGTRPASNVDVKLRFPHTVEIYKKNQLDAVFPTAPTPPERPLTPEEEEARNLCKILNRDFAPPPETDNAPVLPRQAVSVSFLEYHFDKVKHGNPQPLEPLHVLFGSFDDAGSFKIECEISADEQPKKSTGTVSVVVKKE